MSWLRQGRKRARRALRRSRLYVRHRARGNVYHCCLPRTGSQWLRGILRDERVYRYSGLEYHNYYARFPDGYDPRRPGDVAFDEPFPRGCVVSPLYIDYRAFTTIPEAENDRAFFVMRDPRDIVVSWYFAMKHSHSLMGGRLAPLRAMLQELPKAAGLKHSIDVLVDENEAFDRLRSWIRVREHDPRVLVVRYEDLISEQRLEAFRKLFRHCDIRLPTSKLRALLADHSFKKLSGRERGTEDRQAHLRKGEPGDWRNHLAEDGVMAHFQAKAGDLLQVLGYA